MLVASRKAPARTGEKPAAGINGGGAAKEDEDDDEQGKAGHRGDIGGDETDADEQEDQRIGDEGDVFPKRFDGLTPAVGEYAKR